MWRVVPIGMIALLQAACATSGPLYDDGVPRAGISMASYDVTVNDKRPRTDDRSFSVPVVSLPGQEDRISPPLDAPILDSSIDDRAREAIEQSRVAGSRHLVFTINVLEGLVSFSATAFSETEFVSWDLEVRVSEEGAQAPLSIARGESWGRRTSLDAGPNRLLRMYLDSFTQALNRALSRLNP